MKGYSAVTVAGQLYQDISSWYPDLAKAASSRCFSVCRMVFGQVPIGDGASEQDAEDRKALWEVLCRHRGVVAHDPEARLRERLAAHVARMERDRSRPSATWRVGWGRCNERDTCAP